MSILESLDKNMPILVVDDFNTMRRIMRSCLRQLGFQNIEEAEDGAVALEKLKQQPFQFVISDWSMPNMMGIDLLRAVRQDDHLRELPFMMVTAEAQKETVIEATKEGASTYIIKPFTAEVLGKKMESIFKKE